MLFGENNIHNICKYINVISSLDLSFLSKLPKTSLELLVTNLTLQDPHFHTLSLLNNKFCTWAGFCGLRFLYLSTKDISQALWTALLSLSTVSSLAHSPTLSTCLFLPKPHPQMSEHWAPPQKSECCTPLCQSLNLTLQKDLHDYIIVSR